MGLDLFAEAFKKKDAAETESEEDGSSGMDGGTDERELAAKTGTKDVDAMIALVEAVCKRMGKSYSEE